MRIDNSFLRLSTSFAVAKNGDNQSIVDPSLAYKGFIPMKPTETLFQISNSPTPITFVGGITVELVDCCETVVQNITSNFFYEIFTPENGIEQIRFEFGNINVDYWTKPLYLRITDNTNLNVWYSTGFLLTNYKSNISVRLDYWAPGSLNGTTYEGLRASIRLGDCYDHTPVNETNLKQYTQYQGTRVNYRSITTYLRKYIVSGIDVFMVDRLDSLFQHPFIYLDNERVTVSDFKVSERKGDSNLMDAEFTVNKLGETLTPAYQLYEPFNHTTRFVANNSTYTLANFNTAVSTNDIYINFNKAPNLTSGFEYKLYKDGVLVLTASTNTIATNKLTLDALSSYIFANGAFVLVVNSNTVYNGVEFWGGFSYGEWNWTIGAGEFDGSEFDNTEFLTT